MIENIRQNIVNEARSYLGVSVKPHGRSRHAVDCAGLLYLVFNKIIGMVKDFHSYDASPVSLFVFRTIKSYADRIPKNAATIGDIVLLNIGRRSTHFAILVDVNRVIYPDAYVGKVIECNLGSNYCRAVAHFRMKGVPWPKQ